MTKSWVIIAITCVIIMLFSDKIFCSENVAVKKKLETIEESDVMVPQTEKLQSQLLQEKDAFKKAHTNDDRELQKAREALVNFFNYLHDGQYDKAVPLFEPWDKGIGTQNSSWEGILSFVPREKRNEKGKAIGLGKLYQSVGVPIRVKILNAEKVADDEYNFKVIFIKDDGSSYIYGPCCGATEKQMPSQSEFDYFVKRIKGVYKVRTPPLFRP